MPCVLEVRIRSRDPREYWADVSVIHDDDRESDIVDPIRVPIDLDLLRSLEAQEEAYGAALSRMVFGSPGDETHGAVVHALGAAKASGLRLRLNIQGSERELHGLRWELLHEPRVAGATRPFAADPTVWISRFLSTDDFSIREKPKHESINVLLVVADPSDMVDKWKQPKIEVELEYKRAEAAILAGATNSPREISIRRLPGNATVDNLLQEMRREPCDVLYLACHGLLTSDGEPRLLLQDEHGKGARVDGERIVERLALSRERPRLVVLASCQSAARDDDGRGLAGIAPRLGKAGVPSVVAMQGNFTLASAEKFIPRLFHELATHGQIDRAVAEARTLIRDRPDWWMPTMYTHSSSGCLWPTRSVVADDFKKWDAIRAEMDDERCVPVLGPGLAEAILGSTRELARLWSERAEFPLAPRNRDDLAQVAQYLTYKQSRTLAIKQMREYIARHMRAKFKDLLKGSPLLDGVIDRTTIDSLVSHVGKAQRTGAGDRNVYRMLAKLRVPIYVSANRDNLLRDALMEENREPVVELCTWRMINDAPVSFGKKPDRSYVPSVQHPLIFHAFGNFSHPDSLVLTEDDYFSFLTAVTRNEAHKHSVPSSVARALSNSGLLLLGFHADDWDFRVLFSSILRQSGRALAEGCSSVSIQVNPEEGRFINPAKTYDYLNVFFKEHKKVDVFWGTTEEFLAKLLDAKPAQGAPKAA